MIRGLQPWQGGSFLECFAGLRCAARFSPFSPRQLQPDAGRKRCVRRLPMADCLFPSRRSATPAWWSFASAQAVAQSVRRANYRGRVVSFEPEIDYRV
jgi:hypothetical protein